MLPADRASDQTCERVVGGVVLRAVHISTAGKLCLHLFKDLRRDDRLVGLSRMVLRALSIIDIILFGQAVGTVCLLQEQVPGVCVVPQDLLQSGVIELSAVPCPEPFRVQRVCDCLDAHAVKEQGEDPSHDGRFLRFDHERSVHAPVPKHRAVPWAALLEVLPDPPFLVLGRRPCFLLRVAGEDRQHQLALVTERMDVLLLKVHIHTESTQFPDRLQQCDRVTGKA